MGLVVDPYDFTGGTPAIAAEVDARFSVLYGAVNGDLDNDNMATKFLRLADNADHKIGFGSVNLVFTSSPTSALVTVTHGMGGTPVWVGATCILPSNLPQFAVAVGFNAIGGTTFQLGGECANGSNLGPGNVLCYWAAIL